MRRISFWIAVLIFLPMICSAQSALKAQAEAAWKGRDDPQNAILALEFYEQLATKDTDSMIMFARAAYWAIEEMHVDMDKSRKIEVYEKAIAGCKKIVDKDPKNVAAWNWIIWDMGALTMVKGILAGGWGLKDAVVGTIMVSDLDDTYYYGGVYRYWGRVIFETPGLLKRFFNFTDEDSIWLYKQAIAIEPAYLRNHFYLADTYERIGKDDLAKKTYQFCLDQPDGGLAGMEPETRFYKKMAKERLEKM